MKIFPFIKNLLTSPARSKRKKEVIRDILKAKQFNRKIANIYRIDRSNVGDLYSAPLNYFWQLGDIKADILAFKSYINPGLPETISRNSLVIGGGGILNRKSFEIQMKTFEQLGALGKKTVLWGAGHNSKHQGDFKKLKSYNVDLKKFGLAGTRDYSLSDNWVPCVSCLHPLFDKKYTNTRETGIILHNKTLKNSRIPASFKNYSIISNTANMEDFLNFIGSCESVITDSYHGMYWGMLLNKKVVVIPNSSKFFDFKYEPVISTFDSCLEDVKKARSYPGVLEECRERNKDFAKKVFNYLEI